MATTRLMPLHTGKGRAVGQAISAIIDYTENPQKTDGGRLITSWQCDSTVTNLSSDCRTVIRLSLEKTAALFLVVSVSGFPLPALC